MPLYPCQAHYQDPWDKIYSLMSVVDTRGRILIGDSRSALQVCNRLHFRSHLIYYLQTSTLAISDSPYRQIQLLLLLTRITLIVPVSA
jgi:hypothetical protein